MPRRFVSYTTLECLEPALHFTVAATRPHLTIIHVVRTPCGRLTLVAPILALLLTVISGFVRSVRERARGDEQA